jgi:restriction system protein
MTPEEHIAVGYQQIRDELAADLLRRIKECPPECFEQLVVDLLLAMGYGGSRQDAGKAVGRSGDGGIDGIIKEDRIGLDAIYIQAKRWENVVGRPEIQKFAGALQGQRARKGILITTSSLTKEAREFVATIENRIVLIDGRMLA